MSKSYVIFWLVFAIMVLIIYFCNKYFNLLKDISDATHKPYSYSRVQLAFWTIIIFSSFISIYLVTGRIPTFDASTLILLGISTGTTAAASLIDASDQSKNIPLSQDSEGKTLILDILSDNNGISIHRLQTVLFNVVIGIWYIQHVNMELANLCSDLLRCAAVVDVHQCQLPILDKYVPDLAVNKIIPIVSDNNLILMGISAGTYAVLKTNENKPGMTSAQSTSAPKPAPAPNPQQNSGSPTTSPS
jgi:hypothetical protein